MSQKTRQILFYIFVLIFLTLTPAISFYASGYKLGSGLNLQKTGILILDSEPSSAFIYIDGKIQQNFINKVMKSEEGFITTPQKIKNLLPGEYNIKIDKDGYWPWEKKLTVKPGESTFAEDVILFRKNQPMLVENNNLDNNKFLLLDDVLISANDDKLSITKETETVASFSLAERITDDIKLSPSKNKFIAGHYIYSLKDANTKPLNLNDYIGSNAKNIQWGKNDNEIFYLNGSQINMFDIDANKFISITKDDKLTSYLSKENYIYFIVNNVSTSELNIFDLNKNEIIKKISLPLSDYAFKNPEYKNLNLFDVRHETLYIIDPFSPFKPLQETINNLKQSFWQDENTLIYANDFEIWSFDFGLSKKTLITRIGNKIKTVIPHADKNYILFSTDTDINILELDDREKYNITKIIGLEKINTLSINEDGDIIFFSAKIGEQEGVFKLEI